MLLWVVICNLYLFHFTVFLNNDFNCSKSFLLFSFDKITTERTIFCLLYEILIQLVQHLLVDYYYFLQLLLSYQLIRNFLTNLKPLLQLISRIFKVIQKLLKCSTGITTVASFLPTLSAWSSLSSVLPVILVLYLKDSVFEERGLLGSPL